MSYFALYCLIPLAIGSMWAFGSLMKTIGTRVNWEPKLAFWLSAILFGILGFVIPLLLLESSYSDFYFYWIFTFALLALISLIVNLVIRRQERQKSQVVIPAGTGLQALGEVANMRSKNQTAPAPSASERGRESIPQHRTARIFVSYRRSDSADIAGRMYDRLIAKYGREAVFKDVDSIPLGIDFKEYLDRQVSECDVLLAVIGDRWLEAKDASGKNRLNDPADFVRIEIEAALERNIPVIPLLVRDAKMPGEESLPSSLRKLVYRNGIPIRSDPDFHRDMDRLIAGLEKYVR